VKKRAANQLVESRSMSARSLLIVSIVIFSSSNAYGGDGTGNTYKLGCRLLAADTPVPADKIEAVKVGECSGAVDAIFMLRRALDPSIRFCPPPRVAPGQNVRIVAKYLDDHPEQMNDDFTLLVVRAFDQVWPCPNTN
jgi:Rap1a immunity proteins